MAVNPVMMEMKLEVKKEAGEEAEDVEEDVEEVELGVKAEEGVEHEGKMMAGEREVVATKVGEGSDQ